MSPSPLELLVRARMAFQVEEFEAAVRLGREYAEKRDETALPREDRRYEAAPEISIIIVSYAAGLGLVACLDALMPQLEKAGGPRSEVILVDNGGNEDVAGELELFPLLHLKLPCNVGPSEGRNIGARFSQGRFLVFLDDDGQAGPDLLRAVSEAFTQFDFLAIRGRVLPLTDAGNNAFPGHYDLGPYPLPAVLDTEGLCAVRADAWHALGGMDPLMFGAEGAEFSRRLLDANPGREIYYWPAMLLRHDFASGGRLEAKKTRHRRAAAYLDFKGVAAKELSRSYGLWYQHHPAGTIFVDQRSLFERLHALWRELWIKAFSAWRGGGPTQANILQDTSELISAPDLTRSARRERIRELGDELAIIRASLAYRFGVAVSQAIQEPLRKGLLLPFRMCILALEHLRRVDDQSRSGEAVLMPNREEHVCSRFSAMALPPRAPATVLRLACLTGPELYRNLSYEARCGRLSPRTLRQDMERLNPEMVVLSSEWSLLDKGGATVEELAAICRERSVPLVYWHFREGAQVDSFAPAIHHCDRTYAADPEGVERLTALHPGSSPGLLPPAVQPALHHPLRLQKDGRALFEPDATCLYDGWADLLEYPDRLGPLLTPLASRGLRIVESTFAFRANKLEDLADWREHILGCLGLEELWAAMRGHAICVFPAPSLQGAVQRSRRMLEALCCGSSVIAGGWTPAFSFGDEAEGALTVLPDAAFSEQTLAEAAQELLRDPFNLARAVHLTRRALFREHTYGHRLATICTDLGIASGVRSEPLVSVVTPTKRLERLEACLKQFRDQTYENKELVLVINRSDASREELERRYEREAAVTLLVMDQENNIGTCLNHGVRMAGGELVCKMDDDDYYGANYLTDIVQAFQISRADVLGKAPAYVYLQGSDELRLRKEGRFAHYMALDPAELISGATICARRELLQAHPFSERMRSNVDSHFLQGVMAGGGRIHVADPFSFVAFRSVDKAQHTWRVGDTILRGESEPTGNRPEAVLF